MSFIHLFGSFVFIIGCLVSYNQLIENISHQQASCSKIYKYETLKESWDVILFITIQIWIIVIIMPLNQAIIFQLFKYFVYYPIIAFLFSENVEKFTWFSHMWNHQQPHLYENQTQLEFDMTLNRNFAKVSFCLLDFNFSLFYSVVYYHYFLCLGAWDPCRLWLFCSTSSLWRLSCPWVIIFSLEACVGHTSNLNRGIPSSSSRSSSKRFYS